MNFLKKIQFGIKEIILTVGAVISILYINSIFQFSDSLIQEWFRFILKMTIPLLLICYSFLKWKRKIVLTVLAILFILFTFTPLAFFTIFVFMDIIPGNGYRTELSSIALENKNIVVYQNNCGATCSFGIDVAIEKPYLFGIFKTQNFIHNYYPGEDLVLEKIGLNSVKITRLLIDRTDRQYSDSVPVEGEVWNLSEY